MDLLNSINMEHHYDIKYDINLCTTKKLLNSINMEHNYNKTCIHRNVLNMAGTWLQSTVKPSRV